MNRVRKESPVRRTAPWGWLMWWHADSLPFSFNQPWDDWDVTWCVGECTPRLFPSGWSWAFVWMVGVSWCVGVRAPRLFLQTILLFKQGHGVMQDRLDQTWQILFRTTVYLSLSLYYFLEVCIKLETHHCLPSLSCTLLSTSCYVRTPFVWICLGEKINYRSDSCGSPYSMAYPYYWGGKRHYNTQQQM